MLHVATVSSAFRNTATKHCKKYGVTQVGVVQKDMSEIFEKNDGYLATSRGWQVKETEALPTQVSRDRLPGCRMHCQKKNSEIGLERDHL